MYSIRYYLRFHITVVGLGTYYAQLQGHYCMMWLSSKTFSLAINYFNTNSKSSGHTSILIKNNKTIYHSNFRPPLKHVGIWDCENFRITERVLCILLDIFRQLNKMHCINNIVKSVFRILIYKISNNPLVFQLGENLFPD